LDACDLKPLILGRFDRLNKNKKKQNINRINGTVIIV